MNRLIAKTVVKAARKNPRAVAGVVRFVAGQAGGVAKALEATRRVSTAFARAKAVEPVVRREARASAASLTDAVARIRKIGIVNAAGDKQVAKHFDRALRHASDALGGVRNARRTHHLRTAVAGAAPLLVVYGAWRLKSRDESRG